MWRDDFDPETTKILTEAFEIAWAFVRSCPEMASDDATAREILALKIMGLAQAGETDRTALANLAISHLRQVCQTQQSLNRINGRRAARSAAL